MAMEDFRVDVIVGKGPGATAIPLELPPFTLVGATTRAGLLPPPLRDRFGFTGHMEFYAPAELERVIHRSARLLDVDIEPEGAAEIMRPLPGHPAYRQPTPAPRKGLRAGEGRRRDHARGRRAGAGGVRGRRARPGPAGPRRVARAAGALRRWPGGAVDTGGGRGGGAGDGGGGGRTVPGARGAACTHPRGRVATPAAWAHLGLVPPQGGGPGQDGLFGP